MGRNTYLLIHKREWDRMKKQEQNCGRPITNKEDYIKSLNEQSQNWIKNWPDTVQGHINQLEEHNKAEQFKLIESVKEFVSKNKHERNMECLKNAKELIFDDSCYGRQLLSALLASKTLEERKEQIKFQNKIKREADNWRNNEPESLSLQNANEMEINEKKIKECQKHNALEMALVNKTMCDALKRKKLLEKEREKEDKIYEDLMHKLLVEEEKKVMNNMMALHEESVKEYENMNKKIKELKSMAEKEEERKRAIWRNYQERVNYKNKIVFDELHKNKSNRLQYQKVYESIKKLNEEKEKKYNDFVDKGIKLLQESLKLKEDEESKTKSSQCSKKKLLDEENKMLAKLNYKLSLEDKTCECHTKVCISKKPHKQIQQNDTSGPLFLKPKNTLLENLRKREKVTPWNSLNASHAYFAERAADTLQKCRYKDMALQVVQNYRKENHLDATSLPVANL